MVPADLNGYSMHKVMAFIRLKGFCGSKNGRSKVGNVVHNVKQNVKLWFIEPVKTPFSTAIHKMVGLFLKLPLVVGRQ